LILKQYLTDKRAASASPAGRQEAGFRGHRPRRTAIPSFLFLLLVTLAWLPVGPGAQAAQKRTAEAQKGVATYYAKRFHGRRTASGVRLDQGAMVAAHPSLPFGTVVRVTNLRNGRSTEVRVVDRGPAKGPQRRGVIIDLTQGAARELGFKEQGRALVRLDVVPADAPVLELFTSEGEESPA
jgi:rare lipoprotein A